MCPVTDPSADARGRDAAWEAVFGLQHPKSESNTAPCDAIANAAIDAYLAETDLIPRAAVEPLVEALRDALDMAGHESCDSSCQSGNELRKARTTLADWEGGDAK